MEATQSSPILHKDVMSNAKNMKKVHSPFSKVEFFLCPDGCLSYVSVAGHEYAEFLLQLNCSKYNKTWYVCKVCKGLRYGLDNASILLHHIHTKHSDIKDEFKKWMKEKNMKEMDPRF